MNVGAAGKELREWLKSGATWLFIVGCAAAFLFIPQSWAHALRIDELRDRFGPWAGLPLLFGTVGFLVSSRGSIGTAWDRRRARRARQRALRNLSPEEKAILTPYFRDNTKTRPLDHLNGIVQELVSSGILYAPGRQYDITVGVAFTIDTMAWEYLRENPKLLMMTESEVQQLQARRGRRR